MIISGVTHIRDLFRENKGMPEMASSQIKRRAIKLSEFSYTIRYKSIHDIAHADGLSRLHFPQHHHRVQSGKGNALLIIHLVETGSSAQTD